MPIKPNINTKIMPKCADIAKIYFNSTLHCTSTYANICAYTPAFVHTILERQC